MAGNHNRFQMANQNALANHWTGINWYRSWDETIVLRTTVIQVNAKDSLLDPPGNWDWVPCMGSFTSFPPKLFIFEHTWLQCRRTTCTTDPLARRHSSLSLLRGRSSWQAVLADRVFRHPLLSPTSSFQPLRTIAARVSFCQRPFRNFSYRFKPLLLPLDLQSWPLVQHSHPRAKVHSRSWWTSWWNDVWETKKKDDDGLIIII